MSSSGGSNLTAQVYKALREDILGGKFPAGTALTEAMVAEEYAVSRTPVREALRQLELARLVRIIPNKGAVVEGVSKTDIDDIYEIRMLIERLAAEKAAQNAGPQDIAQLQEIIDLTRFYFERKDIEKLKSMDGRFHELIYALSGRRILSDILTDLHSRLIRFRGDSMRCAGRTEQTITEHQNILSAISAGDAKRAGDLMELHIANSYHNIMKLLQQTAAKA